MTGIVAYAPYWQTTWQERFLPQEQESVEDLCRRATSRVIDSVPQIRAQLERAQQEAAAQAEAWEAQKVRWEKEQRDRQIAQAHVDCKKELDNIVTRWNEEQELQRFISQVEGAVSQLPLAQQSLLKTRILKLKSMLEVKESALQLLIDWRTAEERLD